MTQRYQGRLYLYKKHCFRAPDVFTLTHPFLVSQSQTCWNFKVLFYYSTIWFES